jgi:hypothetical protein
MTTSSYSYGNFRRAEEASNAQGVTQTAVDWALQNAKNNPTPENIAIAKDTYSANQTTAPVVDYAKALADAQAAAKEVDATIEEVNKNIGAVNVAGQEAGDIAKTMGGQPWNPISTVSTNKTDKDNIDAFALLEAQLRQWGLDSLASVFISLASQGFKPQEAMNKIKYDTSVNPATGKPWNADYTKRFSGNAARIKQGLNAYSESEYLTLEDSYADTLRRNNLGNLLSVDSASNQAKFAGYMEKGLSAVEFADRIDEVSTRVLNMDPNIKKQFQTYYPGIKDNDIISYVLDPENTMPVLKNKITAAEIGASALQVGLKATSQSMAETLAQSGVSKSEALTGYQQIGEFLPDAELYSQIYKQEGITYNQETAEKDVLLGQAEATRKRKRLASLERAAFEGSSGRLRTGQSSGNSGAF